MRVGKNPADDKINGHAKGVEKQSLRMEFSETVLSAVMMS